MNLLQALILGVVEGLTEFLPISSTGHMVLVSHLMGIATDEFVKTFEIVIQLGAIAAVGVVYGKRFVRQTDLLKRVMLTFTPTGLLGLVFYSLVKNHLMGSAVVTVLSLIIGGLIIIWLERFVLKGKNRDVDGFEIKDLSVGQCLLLGCFQAVAIVPGVSRAAMTIMGGMLLGLSRVEATEFSFLVAAPTLFFASGFDLIRSGLHYSSEQYALLLVGFLVAFITAWIVVRWMLQFLRFHTFEVFGWYRILLGLVYFVLFVRS